MSPKLPAVKPRQLQRVLEKRGWVLDRVTGSHHIYKHEGMQANLSVPKHKKDMRIGTLNRILKDAGISRDEFVRLLR